MNNSRKILSSFLIILCINSLLYYQILDPVNVDNLFDSISDNWESNNSNEIEEFPEEPDPKFPVRKQTIPGDFRLKGMFTHDSNVTFDQDVEVLVLEDFEDMNNTGGLAQEFRFLMDSNEGATWPKENDTYQPLSLSESPFTNSCMFTSSFDYDTLISGKVYVITHIDTLLHPSLVFTFRISLYIYDPLTSNTTEILNYEEDLPANLVKGNQKIFNPMLNDTYLIPANNRLKLRFEGKV